MGLRGPVAKSAEQRAYEGGAAHRPLPAARAAYPEGAPERPKGMSAGARRVWDGYVDQLAAAGVLRPVDAFALQRLCEDVALLQELQTGMRKLTGEMKREAKKQGKHLAGGALMTLTASHEGRRLSASINSLAGRVARLEMQFGLTPVSAQRLESAGGIVTVSGSSIESSIEAALC